jgi:hypothetical protein
LLDVRGGERSFSGFSILFRLAQNFRPIHKN